MLMERAADRENPGQSTCPAGYGTGARSALPLVPRAHRWASSRRRVRLRARELDYFGPLLVSAAMRFPYSLDDSASTSPPSSAKRALIVGSARAALISRLSVSMISARVFFGAPIPARALVSKPVTRSPSVGTSGSMLATCDIESLTSVREHLGNVGLNRRKAIEIFPTAQRISRMRVSFV